jgi:hypothetical protein
MTYCIDYRNGGMGNTMLAHILYSCNKANLDLDNFFSPTGNSHAIAFFRNPEINARHLLEYPDKNANCILQLKSKDWFRVLQYKFSYCKWCQEYPTINNWHKFFEHKPNDDRNRLWVEFYSNIKDSSWPECNTFSAAQHLPEHIQKEVEQLFQPAATEINTDTQLLEFLAVSYYDHLSTVETVGFDAPIYWLNDYFEYKLTPLIEISKELGWRWNEELSKQFYNKMLASNTVYLKWLDNIKQYHDLTISGIVCSVTLDTWERALVIAKICQTLACDIRQLNWQDNSCYLEQDNATLIKLLQG